MGYRRHHTATMQMLAAVIAGVAAWPGSFSSAEQPASVPPEPAAFEPPPFQKLRYDEDYGYLRDPAHRTDFWDPIKYIALNSSGDWYLSLGGEARERFEFYHNYRWNPNTFDQDGYLLQRYL